MLLGKMNCKMFKLKKHQTDTFKTYTEYARINTITTIAQLSSDHVKFCGRKSTTFMFLDNSSFKVRAFKCLKRRRIHTLRSESKVAKTFKDGMYSL